MDIAAMSMDSSLASLQSAISMVTMEKSMNQDALAVASLLDNMQEMMPPVPAGAVGSLMDIKA